MREAYSVNNAAHAQLPLLCIPMFVTVRARGHVAGLSFDPGQPVDSKVAKENDFKTKELFCPNCP